MEDRQWEYFARCAGGFEGVLASELKALRLRQVRPLKGGVAFFGGLEAAYRACLWSRVATRIQVVLARVGARDAAELADAVERIPWEEHVLPGATIAVRARGENQNLRNTQFTALKVKDALCDRLRAVRGARPDVDAHDPDFAIDVALHHAKATIYLNLSGEPLYRRGYWEEGASGDASLRETLAAGMLLAAGWRDIAQAGDAAFIDPCGGAGTLAIEAACIAQNRAPGLPRNRWGFDGWAHHDEERWQAECTAARERVRADCGVRVVAEVMNGAAAQVVRAGAEGAGVAHLVECVVHEAGQPALALGDGAKTAHGLLATSLFAQASPSGDSAAAQASLAQVAAALPAGWRIAVLAPDATVDTAFGLVPEESLDCFNGPLEATLRLYRADPAARQELQVISLSGMQATVPVAEAGSGQFAARLRKVGKERARWARRSQVSCYRIYDADLPDYALSVDLYEGAGAQAGERYLRIAEYQAPAEIDPVRAARRFADALAIAPVVLDVPAGHVFSKVRRHQKGGGQYREAQGRSFVAHTAEDGFTLEVDLNAYLDTGVFLDHRTTRQMVGKLARGMRFLNLFAYTGTATVHAAGGKARTTTTVDLSQTYLDWAQRNMRANGFTGKGHRFERADCLQWLERAARDGHCYDLVFCDPPTFSNSKSKSARTFDVQRDHVSLLQRVAAVLADKGLVVFSCNLRSFKLDATALGQAGLFVEDITPRTIPHDFERNPKIHRCYLLAKRADIVAAACEFLR